MYYMFVTSILNTHIYYNRESEKDSNKNKGRVEMNLIEYEMTKNEYEQITSAAKIVADEFLTGITKKLQEMFPEYSLRNITNIVVHNIVKNPTDYFVSKRLNDYVYENDIARIRTLYDLFISDYRNLTHNVYPGIVVTNFDDPMSGFDDLFLSQLDPDQYANIESGMRERIAISRANEYRYSLPVIDIHNEIERLVEPNTVDMIVRYSLLIDSRFFEIDQNDISLQVIEFAKTCKEILEIMPSYEYFERVSSDVEDALTEIAKTTPDEIEVNVDDDDYE